MIAYNPATGISGGCKKANDSASNTWNFRIVIDITVIFIEFRYVLCYNL